MRPSDITTTYRAQNGRVAYFDNVKFFLMACVVVGHLIKTSGALRKHYARALFLLIYSFHMPLFVFVSGLFLNRRTMQGKRVASHALRFFVLGFVAKFLRAVVPWLLGEPFDMPLLTESGLPWFMFALTAYYVLAWLLRRFDALAVLTVSVIVALAAGYVEGIGDFLCLSRIMVFFPFFWAGHMLTPSTVRHFCGAKEVRCVSAVVLVVCAVTCALWTRNFYPLRKLFFGKMSYAATGIVGCALFHRLAAYVLSILIGTSVLSLTPQRRLPAISTAGTRTLQVYLLHFEVIDVLRHYSLTHALVKSGRWGWLALVPLGVALTLLLSVVDLGALRRKAVPETATSKKPKGESTAYRFLNMF